MRAPKISSFYRLARAAAAILGVLLTRHAVPAQTIYVANAGNNTIQQITRGGEGSLFAVRALDGPSALAFDAAGNAYVANSGNNTIAKFGPDGKGTIFARSGLNSPGGLAFDAAGNLFVANSGNSTIQKFAPDGTGTRFANTGLNQPSGLAFDAAGNLYVANHGNNTIERFTPDGVGTRFAGRGLSKPDAMAFDAAGDLFVANEGDATIEKFNPAGTGTLFATTDEGNPGTITQGLAVDAAGNVWATAIYNSYDMYGGTENDTIEEFAPDGTGTYINRDLGSLSGPTGLTFDAVGNLYVVNANNNTIEKSPPTGPATFFASPGVDGPWRWPAIARATSILRTPAIPPSGSLPRTGGRRCSSATSRCTSIILPGWPSTPRATFI